MCALISTQIARDYRYISCLYFCNFGSKLSADTLQEIDSSLLNEPIATDDLRFVLSETLDKSQLDRIVAEARHLKVSPQRVLFADGWLTPQQYAGALAEHHGISAINSTSAHASPTAILIDAAGQSPAGVAAAVRSAQDIGRSPILFAAAGDRNVSPDEDLAAGVVRHAVEALRASNTELSAGCRMWLWQYIVGALMLGGLVTAPALAGTLALFGSSVVFAGVAAFRVLLLLATLVPPARNKALAASTHTDPKLADSKLADGDLPTYSVLVPLFREAAILPDLIDALAALDYPRAKLDIVLILEESDMSTRIAAERAHLPAHMRTIVVPDLPPRTKPKALNMALALTRGEFVAVFDAEDVPACDQLRKAAALFAAHPGRYASLQARLAIYNPRQSWLSRHFALEYAALFHAILPALVRLGLPFPLSGTSNHFPRAVLDDAAWDPFNVTEDADLGVRLSRSGGEMGLIDSETYEEAPFKLRQWLPQRTRWIKGWMQTYLVHTRQPWRLLRQLGLWRTIGFHAIFAGFLVSVLAYPLLFILLGLELSRQHPFAHVPGSLEHAAFVLALTDMVIGIVASLLIVLIGAWRAGLVRLASHILAAPLYWLLISVAGYRALVQIIWRPYFWEKTEHSPRHGRTNRKSRRHPRV